MANKKTEANNPQWASKDCSEQQVFRLFIPDGSCCLLPKLSLTSTETQYVIIHFALKI